MPALPNPKHERFAQELAKGLTQAEAYEAAGYTPSEPNASRLTRNDKVQARVAEIQERAAVRAEVTLASITADLSRIAQKAEDLSEASGLSVARAAKMDIAKLHGLAADKLQLAGNVGLTHSVQPAELQELADWARDALRADGEAAD